MPAAKTSPSVSEELTGVGKTRSYLLPILALLFVAALLFLPSATVLMPYDEMASYAPATLPSLSERPGFFTEGEDTRSAISAILSWTLYHVLGENDTKSRLVFIVFYLLMCTFVYLFLARRYPQGYALAAVLLLACAPTKDQVLKLRAYGLLLCGTAAMVYFWQRAVEGRRRMLSLAGLWLGFAFSALSDVFSVFLFVPFALAELARTGIRRTRLDKSIWLILITAPSLALFVPSIPAARSCDACAYAFWPRPNWKGFLESYEIAFHLPGFVLLTFLALVAIGARYIWQTKSATDAFAHRQFTRPEWVLVWGLALFPAIVATATVASGSFHPRYAMPSVLGVDLLFFAVLARICNSRESAGYLLAAALCIYAAAAQHHTLPYLRGGEHGERLMRQAFSHEWIHAVYGTSRPVLGATPHDYFEYEHYAPPCLKGQTVLWHR